MAKEHYIIPIFVPHLGCPFECVFCNQRKISGARSEIDIERISLQIEEYMKTIKNTREKDIEIAFYGGSFTGIDKNIQKELLMLAYNWKASGKIKDIRISTRPDYIDVQIMDFLQEYGVSIVELGVQSMDNGVLKASGRGHTPLDVVKAVQIINGYDIKIGLQLMIGLPEDNLSKAINSADACINLNPDFMRIYPTLVIKDTYLESMFISKQYTPLSLEEAVTISKDILLRCIKGDVPVIRVGLQPTENILEGKDLIAGPFHPAFRQIVESRIYRDILEYNFDKYKIYNKKQIILEINDRYLSSLVGIKRSNIKYLSNKYCISKFRIIRNNNLQGTQIRIGMDKDMIIVHDMIQYAKYII